ncbi:MAG: MarR family transcriptional regulator [Deltaproteobacteria bacterium]|nr:MarR family transcriptional regulator [Deltaproteobacteria bacterium]
MGIKPQDILVLLKIVAMAKLPWKQSEVADELGISRAEVCHALDRCAGVGLLDEEKRMPQKAALLEFIQYGLKYVFPAKPGPLCRGIPTSHSASPLSKKIVSDPGDSYVWPSPNGAMRGQEIEPLYPSVATVDFKKAPKLYEMLALVDAIRVGRVRERKIAVEELSKRFRE